jgi:predicted dehydrogenase
MLSFTVTKWSRMSGLRVGVVGLGLGAVYAHALQAERAVDAVVLCDPDPTRLDGVASSVPKVDGRYADLDGMLAAEDLDAVVVVTPDHLHRAHVEAAVAAGCHVLVTKPLATTLDDGRAMVRAAERHGRQLMVAHEMRYHARIGALKELIDGGEFGELIHLRFDHFENKVESFEIAPWYADASTGRTAMVGTAIHEVDVVRHLAGCEVESVAAFGNALGDLGFHDDKTVSAIFSLGSGAVAQVTVSYVAVAGAPVQPFSVLGRRAMALDGQLLRHDAEPEELPPTTSGGFAECTRRFVAALVEGRPVPIDGRDAFASLAACVAADASRRRGAAVRPDRADFE